jgi:hypothetical protein
VLRRIEDLLLLIWYLFCIFMKDIVPYTMEILQRVVLSAPDRK